MRLPIFMNKILSRTGVRTVCQRTPMDDRTDADTDAYP